MHPATIAAATSADGRAGGSGTDTGPGGGSSPGGATRDVLIESATQGRTEHFVPVAIAGEVPGSVKRLAVAGHDGARLVV